LPTLDSDKIKLSSLRGKAVLLNLWCRCSANDTGPSKAEIPTLVELQYKCGRQGFQVIGVFVEDYTSTEGISDYAREMSVNYPIVIGNRLLLKRATAATIFLPITFFLDREGKVIAREIWATDANVYVEHIRRSLGDDPAAQSQR